MLLLLARLALSAEPAEFAGTWVLDADRSEPLDPMLALVGATWTERQAARVMTPTQTITVEGALFTLTVDTGLTKKVERLTIDGEEHTATGDRGVEAATKTTWTGSALVTASRFVLPDGPVVLTMTRTLEEGGRVMRQRLEVSASEGRSARVDRVFGRTEP